MADSRNSAIWDRVLDVVGSIPLFVRVVMLLPAIFSTSALLLGFVALTAYSFLSGFNFLKYLTAIDIATVGTSILLFWFGPLMLLCATVSGIVLICKKWPESSDALDYSATGTMITKAGNGAKLLTIGCAIVLILTTSFGLLASQIHYPPSDRIALSDSGTTYGEIFLNSSDYIVARTSSSFDYDPDYEPDFDSDGDVVIEDDRPSIQAEIVIVKRDQVEVEYVYITSSDTKVSQSPNDDFTASFRGKNDPIPWYQRVLKAPFR